MSNIDKTLIKEAIDDALHVIMKRKADSECFAEIPEGVEPITCAGGHVSENSASIDNMTDPDLEYMQVGGGYKNFIREHVKFLPDIIDLWENEYEADPNVVTELVTKLDDNISGDAIDGVTEGVTKFDDVVHALFEDILTEANYRDIRSDVTNFLQVRAKSKQTPGSHYIGIEGDVLHFKTNSHRLPGVIYDQHVKLLQLPALMKKFSGRKPLREIVRRAIEGDIWVHCTDPSWKYWGFQYIGTTNDFAISPERRFPVIRNPRLSGAVCKHLDNVLYILPFQVQKIVTDLQKSTANKT